MFLKSKRPHKQTNSPADRNFVVVFITQSRSLSQHDVEVFLFLFKILSDVFGLFVSIFQTGRILSALLQKRSRLVVIVQECTNLYSKAIVFIIPTHQLVSFPV